MTHGAWYIFFNGIKRPIHTTISASLAEPRGFTCNPLPTVSGHQLHPPRPFLSPPPRQRRAFRFPRSPITETLSLSAIRFRPPAPLRLVFVAASGDERQGDKARVMLWFHRGGRGHVTQPVRRCAFCSATGGQIAVSRIHPGSDSEASSQRGIPRAFASLPPRRRRLARATSRAATTPRRDPRRISSR